MKVLLTGHNGFIGSQILKMLTRNRIPYGTLSRGELIPRTHFDIILHFAAQSSVRHSIEHPYQVFKDNNDLTIQLLEKAREEDSIFVYPTTATEDVPSNPYSLSKKQGTEWIRLYTDLYSLKAYVLKLFNVYGENSRKGAPYLFCNAALKGERAIVYGDGKQINDYVYVDDVVTFLQQILGGELNPGYYEVGTGIPTTVNSLIMLIEQLSGRSISVEKREYVVRENLTMYSLTPAIKNPLPLKIGIARILHFQSQH